jgi:DNA-binding response OmpR family regulator
MQLSQRPRYGTDARCTQPAGRPSVSVESRIRMSALVLLITRDRNLTKRLAKSLSGLTEDTLTIECVDRLSEATRRLHLNDSVEAVIMDWDLPATRGFETLLVLMGAVPHLPIIILGDDPNLLQQMNLVEHGAQDYCSSAAWMPIR